MRNIVWVLLALAALRLLPRALRREAASLRLIALLCELTVMAIHNTSKAYGTEGRVTSMETRFGTLAGTTLPGLQTTNNGLPDGTIGGSSSSTGLPDGTIHGTSGGASTGTAHTHGPGSFAVGNGVHSHTGGSYAVNNGNHSHNLPNPL